jgi:hypothetical protein
MSNQANEMSPAELMMAYDCSLTEVARKKIPHNRPDPDGPKKALVTYEINAHNTFDAEKYLQAIHMIEDGIPAQITAKKLGVAPWTLYRWKDNDDVTLGMWNKAKERYAESLLGMAGRSAHMLCDEDNVLALSETPKIASAWVNSHAQGARTAIELAKRMNPREYGDRIEHTGARTQVAFVVSLNPTAGAVASTQQCLPPGQGEAGQVVDAVVIESNSVARGAPRRPGRAGKQTVRQPTPPAKQRKQRKTTDS